MPNENTAVNEPLNEQFSALLDGQLPPEQARRLLHAHAHDAVTQEQLAIYQLIGDSMRGASGTDSLKVADTDAFWHKLQAQLPQGESLQPIEALSLQAQARFKHWTSRPAANASAWRWLGGVAASVLMVSVGWYTWGSHFSSQNASQEIAAAGNNAQQVVLRDPELDALLEAHQEVGGHSALQMPAGFIRNATLEWSSP